MGSTLIVLGPVVERRVSLSPVVLFLIGEVLLVDLAMVTPTRCCGRCSR